MLKKVYFFLQYIWRYPANKFKNNKVHPSARLSQNVLISNSTIGQGTYIACNTVINNTVIGSYCSIAPGVQIGGMQHSYWWFSTSPRLSNQCISNQVTHIGNDVWLAAGVIVKQGVTIGDGAVVGAMSFVNKDIPPNTISIGIPAKFWKKRLEDATFSALKKSAYWDYPESRAREILRELESSIPKKGND